MNLLKPKLTKSSSLIITLTLSIQLIIAAPSLSAGEQVKPCSKEAYRQFDFWIGNWQVVDDKGNQLGTNLIKPILNGCALSESWTGSKGFQGVSYNFYDQTRQVWNQTWIDAAGSALYLHGKLEKKSMVLKGAHRSKDGKKSIQKISWTPLDDGRVEQHWQASNDEGKNWKTVFKGFYVKQ